MPSPAPLAPFRIGPWTIALGAGTALLVLAALPPFVGPPVRAALMEGFRLACHQLPGRSFAVGGVPFALCHRCTGLVAGLVGGVLLMPLLGRWWARLLPLERPALLAALTLPGADWLLGSGLVWTNTPASRFLTGLGLGLVAGYLFARTVAVPTRVPTEVPIHIHATPAT